MKNEVSSYKKDLYVSKRPSGMPAWLVPLLVFVLIVVIVFWVAPAIVERLQAGRLEDQEPAVTTIPTKYDETTRVVSKPVADVFDRPDLKAKRVTQVLLNEPVYVQNQRCPSGYVAVRLQDGVAGYMMTSDLISDCSSIEPAAYPYKAIVISAQKRVMSHAKRGTLLAEVMMGTELYIDYRGTGVSRVVLPGGEKGWISDDGVVILPSTEKIKPPYQPRQAFCSTALSFLQATVLENGQTVRGISTVGIVHLSASINGLEVPRTLDGLLQTGQPVPLFYDESTGLLDLSNLLPGDLLFLSDPNNPEKAADVAIYADIGQIIYAKPSQTSIRLMNLNENEDILKRILVVRRLFSD